MKTQHYVGFTTDLVGRLLDHAEGRGARLLMVCRERGIGFKLARTWSGGTRKFERQIKRHHNTPRLCPICNPNALHRMSQEGDE